MVQRRAELFSRLIAASNRIISADDYGKAWEVLCRWTAWADTHLPLI